MKQLLMFALFISFLLGLGCTEKETSWQLSENIALNQINPIGLTSTQEGLWLSDGDRNRLVLIDKTGKILRTIDSLQRPMHIDSENNTLFVPLYGNDIVAKISKKAILAVDMNDSLDAPAGVAVSGDAVAIADFYNHRVLYAKDGQSFSAIGKEGKSDGEFYYPTDVQFTDGKIWVADAYNNRVQVLDRMGKHLMTIGQNQGINAATGLYVSPEELFVTDFENNRVLVFDHKGTLKQTLTKGIDKPTDVLLDNGKLYITNYRNGSLLVLERRTIDQ